MIIIVPDKLKEKAIFEKVKDIDLIVEEKNSSPPFHKNYFFQSSGESNHPLETILLQPKTYLKAKVKLQNYSRSIIGNIYLMNDSKKWNVKESLNNFYKGLQKISIDQEILPNYELLTSKPSNYKSNDIYKLYCSDQIRSHHIDICLLDSFNFHVNISGVGPGENLISKWLRGKEFIRLKIKGSDLQQLIRLKEPSNMFKLGLKKNKVLASKIDSSQSYYILTDSRIMTSKEYSSFFKQKDLKEKKSSIYNNFMNFLNEKVIPLDNSHKISYLKKSLNDSFNYKKPQIYFRLHNFSLSAFSQQVNTPENPVNARDPRVNTFDQNSFTGELNTSLCYKKGDYTSELGQELSLIHI